MSLDGFLVAPPTLKGATAQKVASKLISAGFVKEVKAKASDPVWRRDKESGASYFLQDIVVQGVPRPSQSKLARFGTLRRASRFAEGEPAVKALGKPPATAVSPGDVGTPLFSCPARGLAGVHVETFLRLLIPARRRAELFERRSVSLAARYRFVGFASAAVSASRCSPVVWAIACAPAES